MRKLSGRPVEALRPPDRHATIVAYKGSVARPRKKSGVDQSTEHRITRQLIEPPQTTCLLGRQPKTRHLDKFSADPSDNLLDAPV